MILKWRIFGQIVLDSVLNILDYFYSFLSLFVELLILPSLIHFLREWKALAGWRIDFEVLLHELLPRVAHYYEGLETVLSLVKYRIRVNVNQNHPLSFFFYVFLFYSGRCKELQDCMYIRLCFFYCGNHREGILKDNGC